MKFPVLWSGLGCEMRSVIIHDRMLLPGAPLHALGRSRLAALALKSPVGEWSCICMYVCMYVCIYDNVLMTVGR